MIFALLAASFWVPKGTQPKHSNWFLKGGGGVGHRGDFTAILLVGQFCNLFGKCILKSSFERHLLWELQDYNGLQCIMLGFNHEAQISVQPKNQTSHDFMNNRPVHLNSCAVVQGGYIFNFPKKRPISTSGIVWIPSIWGFFLGWVASPPKEVLHKSSENKAEN